jgi:predicted Zn finger-like uncharacterized protein
MDVTCERCGTEYEFDETLVSDRGTTVKCTHCGHLFKVFRPGTGDGPKTWTIRTRAGRVENLSSLRDLQRLITQGELTREDEISRSGETWKKLGDIAELVTFFAAAEASTRPPRKDGTQPFTTGQRATPFARSPSARPDSASVPSPSVPSAPSRGSGSGTLKPPPHAPPPRHPLPPKPSVPPSAVRGTKSTLPMRSASTAPPAETNAAKPARQVQPAAKRTLFGVGGQIGGAADQTIPDPHAAQRAQDFDDKLSAQAGMSQSSATGFDDQPTEVDDAPPATIGGRTADRSVGRLEHLASAPESGTPMAAVPPTRAMPKMAVPEPAPNSARPVYGDPAPPTAVARPAAPKPAARPAAPKRAMYVDEDAEIAARKADTHDRSPKKSRVGLYVALGGFVVLGAAVGLSWNRIAPLLGLSDPPDRVAEFVARGEAALALDHHDAYEEAIRELTRATAIEERDIRVLAGLSRAHGALAQELAFKTADLSARSSVDPALIGEAAALRREREDNASEARRYGEDAVRLDPNDVSAVLALADALRLTGDARGARSHLDRARTLETDASPEQLYVVSLFELPDPEGSPAAAVESARRAATAAPGMIRARLLLARALLATGDIAGARAEVNAIHSGISDHPHATYLAQAMDRGLPPAAPVVESLDAGVPDSAVDAAVDTEPATEQQQETRPVATGDDPGGAPPRGRDYTWYVARGDELLERGDVGRARAMYEAALEVRSGGSEAETGLGYVMLETGSPSSAVRHFQAASRIGYSGAYMGLGDAYRQMGQRDNALAAYRDYLSRYPTGPEAHRARSQITALGGDGAAPDPTPNPTPGPDPTPDPDPDPAPPTAPDELPAPRGATEADLPAPDSPAIGSE